MWILESAGDFLNGKRLWLKPGKKYLFGRVKRDGVRFAIEHKTVSRRHLVIEVAPVADSEVGQLHARTRIKIVDQNSKSGTTVNGHLLKAGQGLELERELDKAENSVRPGNSEELLIRWQPCVITFNLQKKEVKAGVLRQKQERVRQFGIKAIADFAADVTTHLVVAKRNTPKGLQALIAAKYLVTESFIDAIEYAATPSNIEADEDASPLELDFDSHWPHAADYLPPPGREPTSRPVHAYQPGPDRSHVFENYTFVFGDQNQFDNLLPVITAGHGKALHFKVDQGTASGPSTVAEVTQLMQKGGVKGAVLLVRWEPKGSDKEKEAVGRFIDQVVQETGLRPVEQAEFLEAILANDASVLKQPVSCNTGSSPVDRQASPAPAPAPAQAQAQAQARANSQGASQANGIGPSQTVGPEQSGPEQPAPEPSQALGLAPRKDRFGLRPPPKKDLIDDDDFNPDDIAEYVSEGEEEAEVEVKTEIKADDAANERKRRRASSVNSFEEQMDDLLPAATAMKRQNVQVERTVTGAGAGAGAGAEPKPKTKKRKVEKEINIQEVIRSKREQEREDEERRKEQLQNLPPLDETDRGPANLVVVETLSIPIRSSGSGSGSSGRVNPEDDPRWDPRWNGRKNFKKFRPQSPNSHNSGNVNGRVGNVAKVYVPLVEVKRKDDGTGDRYWEKTEEERERERQRQRQRQRQQQQRQHQHQRQHQPAQRRRQPSELESESESESEPEPGAGAGGEAEGEAAVQPEGESDEGRDMVAQSRSPTQARTETQPQPQRQRQNARKRSASTLKGRGGADADADADGDGRVGNVKKQKTLALSAAATVVHGSDSDGDGDEMKFRFKRAQRRR